MTTTLHAAAPIGQIHSPVNWIFSTAAARQAVGTYTTLQLGCEALQTDTSPPTLWKLLAVASPGSAATPTWRQITTTADSGGGGGFTGDFGAIFTTAGLTVLHSLEASHGLHKTGSIVNSWDAYTGPTITELTGGVGIGTASTLLGHPDIEANSTTQGGTYTLVLPAPTSTVGVFMWHVMQLVTTPTGSSALDSDAGFRLTTTFNSTPVMTSWDGGSTNAVAAFGVVACTESAYDNTASSYGKFGASAATTGNPGSVASGGARGLFFCPGPSSFLGAKLLAKVTCTGTLANFVTAAAAAKTQAQSYYGGSVT